MSLTDLGHQLGWQHPSSAHPLHQASWPSCRATCMLVITVVGSSNSSQSACERARNATCHPALMFRKPKPKATSLKSQRRALQGSRLGEVFELMRRVRSWIPRHGVQHPKAIRRTQRRSATWVSAPCCRTCDAWTELSRAEQKPQLHHVEFYVQESLPTSRKCKTS